MSMVVARSPLGPIGMNAPKQQSRRSARLSGDGNDRENDTAAARKGRGAGVGSTTTTTVGTKELDGGAAVGGSKKKRKVYEEEVDGFAFTKKRARGAKDATASAATAAQTAAIDTMPPPPRPAAPQTNEPAAPAEPKTVDKRARRRLPTTPDRDGPKTVRRSKRISNEGTEPAQQPSKSPHASPQKAVSTAAQRASPHKPAHARSHAKQQQQRSPSPQRAQPVTVEKKRHRGADGIDEEQKTMRIALPFQDTPVIRRNREMRKTGGEATGGSRRSSTGMRGHRASSLIDDGRGNALPHAEVPSSEFYKHISADITEPRRMRCLLGWCGIRALPPKPDAPKENSSAADLEFRALQAARVVQEELSQDLITKGTLSDWFSRDDDPPTAVALRKKPNPRNVFNAAKAEELEKQLERLKKERADWDALIASAASDIASSEQDASLPPEPGALSPLNLAILDSPQRRIFDELHGSRAAPSAIDHAPRLEPPADPATLQARLRHVSDGLEFAVDRLAHDVHVLGAARDAGLRLADHTLAAASDALAMRERERRSAAAADGKAPPVDPLVALRGLARVLNGQQQQQQHRG